MTRLPTYELWLRRKVDTCTLGDMEKYLSEKKCRGYEQYKKGMQIESKCRNKSVTYKLSSHPAQDVKDLHTKFKWKKKEYEFKPQIHPRDMLTLGVFEGKMINDCMQEYPREWFERAISEGKLSPAQYDPTCNAFGVRARSSLREWKQKKWIYGIDTRGWFQWYIRYCLGRRDPKIDPIQMKRWLNFGNRFKGMLRKYPQSEKIQQNLLQWAYYA